MSRCTSCLIGGRGHCICFLLFHSSLKSTTPSVRNFTGSFPSILHRPILRTVLHRSDCKQQNTTSLTLPFQGCRRSYMAERNHSLCRHGGLILPVEPSKLRKVPSVLFRDMLCTAHLTLCVHVFVPVIRVNGGLKQWRRVPSPSGTRPFYIPMSTGGTSENAC